MPHEIGHDLRGVLADLFHEIHDRLLGVLADLPHEIGDGLSRVLADLPHQARERNAASARFTITSASPIITPFPLAAWESDVRARAGWNAFFFP